MRSAAVIVAVIIGAAAISNPAHAGAPLTTVSPGDRIDTPNLCTVGYTYTGADDHTYAITADHCATGEVRPIRDQRSGATGTFITSVVDPPSAAAPTTAWSTSARDPSR